MVNKKKNDGDGDTCSVSIAYTVEAIAQINALLSSKKSIVNTRGTFIASADTLIPSRVFNAFTGDPI